MSQNYTDSSSDMTDELWHTVINSDSDEELQMLCRAVLEEERENLRRKTRVQRGSIQGHVTAAVRMLVYGVAVDAMDDYVRIVESTSIESLKRFVQAIIDVFGNEYLRTPNNVDICRLLSEGERRGFLGMLGSIDCMHWKWKNCQVTWKGMHARGDHRESSLILEAATFIKTIPCPNEPKATNFAAAQESAKKDVELAFEVLQARFAIVRGLARLWDRQTLQHIMKACIIMHNLIIEDECDQILPLNYDAREGECSDLPVSRDHTAEF
ncbi:putative nuclease HARBI1 [Cinnamomum micranthum f. kanehirae]|uniref:Putative nuclease HARBI1 n=1 Tax=Cinnamomum micranthum f. kanehirae TaxID=337451 RepID=A0A3S3MQC3_9MAGN|nr:putative nuclease HARBI1 [Cinnamomum micranthum f. kanehirae]